jgi:hypothetical protein
MGEAAKEFNINKGESEMLRKIKIMMAISAAMIFALAVITSAQTLNTNIKSDKPEAKAHSGEVRHSGINELWKDSKSLSDDWARIEEHYTQMMQINDPAQLKAEMVKHQEMMSAYHNKMMADQELWRKTMAEREQQGNDGTLTHAKATANEKMTVPTSH